MCTNNIMPLLISHFIIFIVSLSLHNSPAATKIYMIFTNSNGVVPAIEIVAPWSPLSPTSCPKNNTAIDMPYWRNIIPITTLSSDIHFDNLEYNANAITADPSTTTSLINADITAPFPLSWIFCTKNPRFKRTITIMNSFLSAFANVEPIHPTTVNNIITSETGI